MCRGVSYYAYLHVFSPISSHEILIMNNKDVSIFDTRSKTIENVATLTFDVRCENNQSVMIRDGKVLMLVRDCKTEEYKIVSYTKGQDKLCEIKDFPRGRHGD